MINKKGLVAVKFSAVWCAPCKPVAAIFKRLSDEFDKIEFQSIDVDDQPDLAKEFKIRSVPTVILFKDGQEIDRLVGAVTAGAMRKSLRDFSEEAAA